MFKILGVDHIGVAVPNLAEAGTFWSDILGLPHTKDETVEEQKARIARMRRPFSKARMACKAAKDDVQAISSLLDIAMGWEDVHDDEDQRVFDAYRVVLDDLFLQAQTNVKLGDEYADEDVRQGVRTAGELADVRQWLSWARWYGLPELHERYLRHMDEEYDMDMREAESLDRSWDA